jgi:hypothetical protein
MTDPNPEHQAGWDKSDTLGVVFLVPFMIEAIREAAIPHSIGWSIGMLTLVAATASIRLAMKLGMKGPEMAGWLTVFLFFTLLELSAIKRNDQQNIDDRNAQNAHFKDIADELTQSLKTSREQYDSTISRVDGVLKTTRSVASLAKENLENVTGGDTYAYVVPNGYGVPSDQISFDVCSKGRYILTGVSVKFVDIHHFFRNPHYENEMRENNFVEDVGTLHPGCPGKHMQKIITPLVDSSPGFADWYDLFITSQNVPVFEQVFIRKRKDQKGWAYRYDVFKQVAVPCPKGIKGDACPKQIPVTSVPWSDEPVEATPTGKP